MKKTTEFEVTMKVVVEYEVPEGVATTPYTRIGVAQILKTNDFILLNNCGTIIDAAIKKVVRQPEDKNIIVGDVVAQYFLEHGITNLMDYGTTQDYQNSMLGDISEVYADILKQLHYNVTTHYAEDGAGDGKYHVSIQVGERTQPIGIDVKAWHGVDEVARDIEDIIDEIDGNRVICHN
jgi:hypothetical protein